MTMGRDGVFFVRASQFNSFIYKTQNVMKKKLTSILLFLLVAGSSVAQDAPTMFAVYEIHVKPTMNATYQEAAKKFKATCQQQKMTFTWYAGVLDDNAYIYLVPMKNFADLDKNMFADLEARIGKEALASQWQAMDKCVEYQTSSATLFLPGSSYLSPGPDDYFRNVLHWIPEVGKEAEAEKLIAEWVKLYTSKKATNGVQTYRNIFGGEGGYVFVSWGKNAADYASKDQKTNELFGDEASKLWAKTLLITRKYYTVTGWISTELSYSPSPN